MINQEAGTGVMEDWLLDWLALLLRQESCKTRGKEAEEDVDRNKRKTE